MHKYLIKNSIKIFIIFSFTMVFLLNTASAQLPDDGVDNSSNPQIDNITELTKQAEQHFLKG